MESQSTLIRKDASGASSYFLRVATVNSYATAGASRATTTLQRCADFVSLTELLCRTLTYKRMRSGVTLARCLTR